MELRELFERVSELASKGATLSLDKEETKELMKLSRDLSAECRETLYDWRD